MPKITYIAADGQSTTLDVTVGSTVMEAAVAHGVAGIVAECGGNAMCATCHVYVETDSCADLPEMLAFEDEMLDATVYPRTETSRLSCQLAVTDQLDGLVVHLPETQI
jgi:2Fe-2S ferredoxin